MLIIPIIVFIFLFVNNGIYFYLIKSQNKKPLFMRSSLSEILFIFLLAFTFACAGHNFLENLMNFFC